MSTAQHRRYWRRLLRSIKRQSEMGDTSHIGIARLFRECERFLNSHAVQSTARHQIWSRDHGLDGANARWNAAQIEPVVPFDYRRMRGQPIVFHHKPRATSGLRKICSLPETLKMWHMLARDLIIVQHQPRPHIGDWKGRGREWQIDQILAALTSRNQAVVSADISRAFASVNIDAVYELPYLPELLIRRAIDYRSHRFVRRERSEYRRVVSLYARNEADEVERSPSGLMEGSPASNAIFSVLMDDLPDHVGEGIQTFIYCDNIILIAPSMPRALRAQEALARYLTGHRAGPFAIRGTVTPAHDYFDHLGYSIQRRGRSRPDVGLSLAASNKLGAQLEDEQRDLREAVKWLLGSYNRCTPDMMAGYIQRIVDEAGFRSQRA